MLQEAWILDWKIRHVDIKAAFVNGDLDALTLVGHPYNFPPDLSSNQYYNLHNALYGLKQAPLQWYLRLRETLTS